MEYMTTSMHMVRGKRRGGRLHEVTKTSRTGVVKLEVTKTSRAAAITVLMLRGASSSSSAAAAEEQPAARDTAEQLSARIHLSNDRKGDPSSRHSREQLR